MKNYFVYRLVRGDGSLAYIGQTGNLNQRIVQLQSSDKFKGVESLEVSIAESRKQARAIEALQIRIEKPEMNIQHNRYKYQMELF